MTESARILGGPGLARGSPEGLIRWIDKIDDVVGGIRGRINEQAGALLRFPIQQRLENTVRRDVADPDGITGVYFGRYFIARFAGPRR